MDSVSRCDVQPVVDRAFWRGKRVLVTGHTGFKGAWLSMWLSELGAQVSGYALPPESPSLYALATLDRLVDSELGDVRDVEKLDACVARTQPEIVMHLAAQAFVRESYARPVDTFAINVLGTANLLQSLRAAKRLRSVLVVTSDKCYRNDDASLAFAEDAPLGGDDPYSASKACAEIVTGAYRESYFRAAGVPVATARAGNVIGGGDWSPDRIVPDIVAALRGNEQLRLRYPNATRPWQHVLEPLYGYLVLAQVLAGDEGYAGAWNFGPKESDALSVAELVSTCFARWGATQRGWIHEEKPQPAEHHRLSLNADKAERLLGVRNHLGFDERCAWTIDWYKGWIDGQDARALCEDQISRYMALAGAT